MAELILTWFGGNMNLKYDDRVNVYTDGEVYKGHVCAVRGEWVGVDLDNGMLTDWFHVSQCKKIKEKER